jgi:vacuolar protein sorting-associated protein 13A/C
MNIFQRHYRLNYYERKKERFTITKLKTEINGHYQHQLFKQVQVAVLDLDVLGNPFHVIRGVAEGVESFFYEPYKVNIVFFFGK